MASPSPSSESFRDLLVRLRGRTSLRQRDLAARLGMNRRSVQDWETGANHPTAERLKSLLLVLLDAGALTTGSELTEARQLWDAALHDSSRMRSVFDERWFASVVADHTTRRAVAFAPRVVTRVASDARAQTGSNARAEDWGQAPDVFGFIDRDDELATLMEWLQKARCRLVAVVGMGGIGKTVVAARLAHLITPNFQRVYWRSLRDAPPVIDWLAGAIPFLAGQQQMLPEGEAARIEVLLEVLRERPSLIVLDNFETVLAPGESRIRYRDDYAGYGRLLQIIGESPHQSCLLVTSRESPPELALFDGRAARKLDLAGLGAAEGRLLLGAKGLSGNTEQWSSLVHRFGGNALALKIVGESIRELFGGEVGAFLDEVGSDSLFGSIRRLLGDQFERCSPVEQKVLRLLAVEREPISVAELVAELEQSVARGALIEALEALRRRSLVERAESGGPAAFALQSVVLEYVTDRLVKEISDEICSEKPVLLIDQPLMKAQAKDYVRQTQERLIGGPIVERLRAEYGPSRAEQLLLALLAGFRDRPRAGQGYGPGNVVNLLQLLRGDLRGVDLSQLSIRHAYLMEVEAQDASLEGADLADSVLADAFDYPIALALSHDGTQLAAGTPTGEIRLWRVGDRIPTMAARAHTGGVWGVALSGNGQRLATGSENGEIAIWEAASGRPLARFQGHDGAVWGVALSSDASLLGSCSLDGTVKLWETTRGQLLATLQGHRGGVVCLSLSSDGRVVASGSEDGTVRLWDSPSSQVVAVLEGHSGGVWGVAVSGDGQTVASSSYDETVKLWDTKTHQLVTTLQGHAGPVRSVALSDDGRLVASGGFDATVRVWDSATGQALALLQGHAGGVMSVALGSDARLLASGSLDGTVKLWDLNTKQLLATLQGRTSMTRGLAMSADGQLLATGTFDGNVHLWDTRYGKLLATLQVGRAHGLMSVGLNADGRLMVTGCFDGTGSIWDWRTGQTLATLRGHTGGVRAVAFSRDSGLLASGSFDATVRLWSADTGQMLASLEGHTGAVWGVAISGDGRLVASGSFDGTVRLWDAHRAWSSTVLEGHTRGVVGVALSTDRTLLASGGEDGTIRLWETDHGRPLQTLEGHTSGVWGVALSADGRLLASGSFDGTVRLWDPRRGRPLAVVERDAGGIEGIALSEDGRLLVSSSKDGMLVLWDTETAAVVRTLRIDRRYERMDITGLTGITEAQCAELLALGAVERG